MLSYADIVGVLRREAPELGATARDLIATALMAEEYDGGEMLVRVGQAHPSPDGRRWHPHAVGLHMQDVPCYVIREDTSPGDGDPDYGPEVNRMLVRAQRLLMERTDEWIRRFLSAWELENPGREAPRCRALVQELREEWREELPS